MKAALLVGKKKFTIKEIPIPDVSDDEVLIRIEVTGICGSDVHVFNGEQDYPYPVAIGHEIVGRIEKIGSRVKKHKTAQRVSILPSETCGRCAFCKSGRTNLCDNILCIGELPDNGGFAEYVKVKSNMVFQVPETVTLHEASLMEPVAAAHYISKNVVLAYGKNAKIGIMGMGTIGLLILQVLKRWFHCSEVYGFDIIDERLTLAKKLGADEVYNLKKPLPAEWPSRSYDSPDLYKSGVFDVIIDCAAVTTSLNGAIKLVKKTGRVVLVGEPSGPITLDIVSLKLIVLGEITVIGTMQYTAGDFTQAIKILQNHLIDSKSMVTKTEPLSNVQKAFEDYIGNRAEQIKVLVES